jgi:hypothetical protein
VFSCVAFSFGFYVRALVFFFAPSSFHLGFSSVFLRRLSFGVDVRALVFYLRLLRFTWAFLVFSCVAFSFGVDVRALVFSLRLLRFTWVFLVFACVAFSFGFDVRALVFFFAPSSFHLGVSSVFLRRLLFWFWCACSCFSLRLLRFTLAFLVFSCAAFSFGFDVHALVFSLRAE